MKRAGGDQHNLMPPHILQNEERSCFVSKTFLIRYCEEEVEVNDIVLFRAELDVVPEYLSTEFMCECELYFSDLSNLGGPTQWKQHQKEYSKKAQFTLVQS